MSARLIAAAVAALAAGCTQLDYARCGDTVCPVGTACCGEACVAATCGDGVRDPGEACDQTTSASCYGPFTAFGDFGQLGCTGTCALDTAVCGRFGFVGAALPCEVPQPTALAASGDTVWLASADGVTRVEGGTCTALPNPSVLTRLAALPGAAVVAYNQPDDEGAVRGRLAVVDGTAWTPLTSTAQTPIRDAVAVDASTAVVRRNSRSLSVVSRAGGAWAVRDLTVGCAAATGVSNVGRRIDAVVPVGDRLAFALHDSAAATRDTVLGSIPLASLVTGPTTIESTVCEHIPGAPVDTAYVDGVVAADGAYLVGSGRFSDDSKGAVVVRLAPGTGPSPQTTLLLGEGTRPGVDTLLAVDQAWVGLDGELTIAQGGFAMAWRDQRWRALAPSRAQVVDVTRVGASLLAASPTGVAGSRGHGYQVVVDLRHDLGVASCDPGTGVICQALAAGRTTGSQWLLAATTAAATNRLLLEGGVRRIPRVAGVNVQPRRIGFGQGSLWLAVRSIEHDRLWLTDGLDDPRPMQLVTGAFDVEVDQLEVGPRSAAALARVIRREGDPIESAVVARTRAGEGQVVWTSALRIDAIDVIATADGRDAIVAVVTAPLDPGPAETILYRLDGTQRPPVLARLPGVRVIRALWGEDLDHLWLAGDDGALLRYEGGQLVDRSADLAERADLRALVGTGADDVFLAGAGGSLHHFDGQAWTAVAPWQRPGDLGWLGLVDGEVWLAATDEVLALRMARAAPPAPVCEPGP